MSWFKKKIAYDQESYIQNLSRENPYPFKEWFDDNGRSYFPFQATGTEPKEGVDPQVEAQLTESGYQITDYRKGYCASGNRVMRIGKVLNSLKQRDIKEINNRYQQASQEQNPIKYKIFQNQMQEELKRSDQYYEELIETFINSAYRTHQSNQNSGFTVVVSQNPHDVAQMSTGRNWTSCMDLGDGDGAPGSHHEDVYCEVQNGGLVAYLIRSDDTEIEDPLARIHIRRFDNRSGKSVAIPEKSVYGNEIKGFQQSVQSWLNQRQGDITPGAYKRQGGEYSDTFGDNMLVSPSNIEGVLSWLRGEGEDAQFSTWSVNDHLFLEYDVEDHDNYGGDYYEAPSEVTDLSKTFNTKEEAEAYLAEKLKYDQEHGEYERQGYADETNPDSEWLDRDEETGEWEEQRFFIQENKTDHRSNMTNEAIKQIIKAPKETYPPEVIQEVKDMVFNSNVRNDNNRREFLRAYPELSSGEELSKMNDSDQLDIYKKLSPEQQEQQKQQWTDYVNSSLDNPDMFINEEVQKRMRERDMSTDVRDRVHSNDSVGLMYSHILDNWLFNPLKEVFKPIPEPIIQKLVNFGINFTKEDNPLAPYKDMPKYDNQILSRIITTLSQTGSDTPSVQNFYKQMLPRWVDNRKTYYDNWSDISVESLGYAIGKLGENGREFLPFIEGKIKEEKEAINKLEQSIPPEKREWETSKDFLRRAYKKMERLYNIKQSIDPENSDGMRYRWSKNWFKKVLYGTQMNWFKKAQSDPNQKTIENFNRNKESGEPYYRSMELVPIGVLRKYREYDRTANPLNRETYEKLKADIMENGIKDIAILQYGTETDTAILGEGNHRLAIAEELGIEAIPVRVVRQRNTYQHSDISFPPQQVRGVIREKDEYGYEKHIPGDLSPSQIGLSDELV